MLENYTILQLAIMACMVFGAFVIRGMSGFGAGMIGIPLLAFLIPVHTAVSMFGLMVLVLFTFLSIRDWREVVRHELKLLLVPTLLGVVAGVLLFKHLDSRLLLQLLGGFLIAYALYTFAVNYFRLPEMTCSDRWAIPVGFVGAVIDTLFGGGGGTLVVIYLHLRRVGRAPFRATVAMLWLFEMIARIAGLRRGGLLHDGLAAVVRAAAADDVRGNLGRRAPGQPHQPGDLLQGVGIVAAGRRHQACWGNNE